MELLQKICDKYQLDVDLVKKVIEIERDNVHKKRRNNIFNDLKKLVAEACEGRRDSDC